jgi:hypothetical protein
MTNLAAAKPLAFPAPFPDTPVYLIGCYVTREMAHRILGPPMLTRWTNGLGNGDGWAFEYPCGLQVLFRFLHDGEGGIVSADSPEINHVLRHIPCRDTDCVPIDEEALQSELKLLITAYPNRQNEIESLHAFQVWRQDDNGNSFKGGTPTSERHAKCWVEHFESLGHRQTYWYARVTLVREPGRVIVDN